MEEARLFFADPANPVVAGALLLGDDGRLTMEASPGLIAALNEAPAAQPIDLGAVRLDDPVRGPALAAALRRGVPATLLELEFAAGALEMRAYILGGWVRLTLVPGAFDPDAAWEFLLVANEAELEAPRP